MADKSSESKSKKRTRVAVVGGGIGGLYAAHRLHETAGSNVVVDIFEATERFGGRIMSVPLQKFGLPFPAELGAMRFYTNHNLLVAMIKRMGMGADIVPYSVEPPMLFLRNRRIAPEDLDQGRCDTCRSELPFDFKSSSIGAISMVRRAIASAARDLSLPNAKHGESARHLLKLRRDSTQASRWRAVIPHEPFIGSVPLSSVGFQNLLQHYLGFEEYAFVHHALGLDSVVGNWAAEVAIPWFLDDFKGLNVMTVKGGLGRLTESLIAGNHKSGSSFVGLKEIDSINLHASSPVSKIEKSDTGYVVSAASLKAQYDHVVIAVPPAALRRIELKFSVPEWIQRGVSENRLFKLFMVYEMEWWMGDSIPDSDTGRVFTDLPVRQVYYFSPRWMERISGKQENSAGSKKLAMILASYSDAQYADFWDPMISNKPQGHNETSISYDGKTVQLPVGARRASSRMMEKVHQQLCVIHGRDVPRALWGFYMDWASMPFGAGWHTWLPGQDKNCRSRCGSDLPQNFWVCGEAWSFDQGWIEGALKTAECVVAGISSSVKAPTRFPPWVNFGGYISPYDPE